MLRMSNGVEKLERKTIEKNRRIQMKALCYKLTSLIPPQHLKPSSKGMLSLPDQIDQATNYIQQLKERVDVLKSTKKQAENDVETDINGSGNSRMLSMRSFPRLELKDLGSGLEVVLVTGTNMGPMLHEIINILEEEGAQVVSASVSTVGDMAFHTLHAQARVSRVGVDTSRVCGRLQKLIS